MNKWVPEALDGQFRRRTPPKSENTKNMLAVEDQCNACLTKADNFN